MNRAALQFEEYLPPELQPTVARTGKSKRKAVAAKPARAEFNAKDVSCARKMGIKLELDGV
jgi:hypothetical protein